MYFGTKMLESYGLDDVVGAIPVHMFAGIFGTLVVPLTNSLIHRLELNLLEQLQFASSALDYRGLPSLYLNQQLD